MGSDAIHAEIRRPPMCNPKGSSTNTVHAGPSKDMATLSRRRSVSYIYIYIEIDSHMHALVTYSQQA